MRLRATPCPSLAKEGSLGAVFGVEAGFSCPDIARAPLANAPPAATFFKNSRRSNFPFFFRVATIPSCGVRRGHPSARLRRQQGRPCFATLGFRARELL